MILYCITNLVNNKKYIGQTRQKLSRRIQRHIKHSKSAVHFAVKKYGFENFKVEVLAETTSPDFLNLLEEFFILKYNTMSPNGYNLVGGGNNRTIVSEKTKEKMRTSQLKVRTKYPHPMRNKIGKLNVKSIPVICLNNNTTYESARQAAITLNVNRSHISAICKNKGRKSTKGFRFVYASRG